MNKLKSLTLAAIFMVSAGAQAFNCDIPESRLNILSSKLDILHENMETYKIDRKSELEARWTLAQLRDGIQNMISDYCSDKNWEN